MDCKSKYDFPNDHSTACLTELIDLLNYARIDDIFTVE